MNNQNPGHGLIQPLGRVSRTNLQIPGEFAIALAAGNVEVDPRQGEGGAPSRRKSSLRL